MRNLIPAGWRRRGVLLGRLVIGKLDLSSAKTRILVLVGCNEITHNWNRMPVSQKMSAKGMRKQGHHQRE